MTRGLLTCGLAALLALAAPVARAAALAEIDTFLATRLGASLNAASTAAGVPTLR